MTPEDREKVDQMKNNYKNSTKYESETYQWDREKVEELKRAYKDDLERVSRQLELDVIAKTEAFWEVRLCATEEDLPRLRDWVDKTCHGSYRLYYDYYIDQDHPFYGGKGPLVIVHKTTDYDDYMESRKDVKEEGVWYVVEDEEEDQPEERTWWQIVKDELKAFIKEL